MWWLFLPIVNIILLIIVYSHSSTSLLADNSLRKTHVFGPFSALQNFPSEVELVE